MTPGLERLRLGERERQREQEREEGRREKNFIKGKGRGVSPYNQV